MHRRFSVPSFSVPGFFGILRVPHPCASQQGWVLPLRVPDPSVLRVGLHGKLQARTAAFMPSTSQIIVALF